MQGICRALKPGGRVVFVEYRGEDPNVPIKPLHKMTQAQVRKEMSVLPLDWVQTIEVLPRQHILVFRIRPTGKQAASAPAAATQSRIKATPKPVDSQGIGTSRPP